MKLLHSSLSPYSGKVRMAALHAGIELEYVAVDTKADPNVLLDANPLGKVPTLVDDEGQSFYDSRVITQYLNRQSGNRLFPRNPAKRAEAERLEALADGICDSLVSIAYERRYRPEDLVHQPWINRQWDKVERALDMLNASPPKLPKQIHVGHIALRATLAYLEIRYAGQWEKRRGKLTRWSARFDEKFPGLKAVAPHT